jgi:glycine/D-amino acid oxidase-like deaminating enzyme
VNPIQLVQGLAEVVHKKGVRIFEYAEVQESNLDITANGYSLNFNTVVYAKDAYTENTDILRYNTTCAVTEVLPLHTLSMLHLKEHKMYIENQISSYHYMKMTKDRRILIGFGDRKTKHIEENMSVIEDHVRNIKKYIKNVFPTEHINIEYAWTGTYGLHTHPLPFVSSKENKHVFAGAGTQVATVVIAEMIADRVVGKQHVLNPLF